MVTSAGSAPGSISRCLWSASITGAKTAVAVAKRLVVVAQRQGGQSQFSPYLAPIRGRFTDRPDPGPRHGAASPIATRLNSLAAVAGMSPRNLARHFVQETGRRLTSSSSGPGSTPPACVLEGGDTALKAVAFECGFGTADRMRVVFTERPRRLAGRSIGPASAGSRSRLSELTDTLAGCDVSAPWRSRVRAPHLRSGPTPSAASRRTRHVTSRKLPIVPAAGVKHAPARNRP